MTTRIRPDARETLAEVIEISAQQFGVKPHRLSAATRPVQDLGVDSLDLIEWFMEIEEAFGVTLPDPGNVRDQVYKQVFTRAEFCLGDMVELVQLRWGSGAPDRPRAEPPRVCVDRAGFAQLGGILDAAGAAAEIHEPCGEDADGRRLFRRRIDGMPCVLLAGGPSTIGGAGEQAGQDERPVHQVTLSPFVIDVELVSTTAFCRFLNSVGVEDERVLRRWFLLEPDDRRRRHEVVARAADGWRPVRGAEEWPMVLVSWHGAHAYARWAHGCDPLAEGDEPSFLPSEAQWEHAVRGGSTTTWPWGEGDPPPGAVHAGRARAARRDDVLPLLPVHALDGAAASGLRGALGHVWQWCRDWYDPGTYARRAPGERDPVQARPTGVRAERGGSWVGPVSVCRPAYRRGRVPHARGRCLGFRCAMSPAS